MNVYIVVLLLTFSDGSSFQDNKTAQTEATCQDIIKEWVGAMHKKYERQSNPLPTTFITGCVQSGNVK